MGIIRRYLVFVKPYRLKIIATLIIGIIKFAIPLMIPVLMKYVIDDVLEADGLDSSEKTTRLMTTMGLMLFIFVVVRPPTEYYRQYFAQWTASKILYQYP